MTLTRLAQIKRTVRHLRPSQVYWRLRYQSRRRRAPDVPSAPDKIVLRSDMPEGLEAILDQAGDEQLVGQLERGEFAHLNRVRVIGREQPDWALGRCASDRLWVVTLHYHGWVPRLAGLTCRQGDLGYRAAELLRHYLLDWIARCPVTAPGSRELAWNAYAVATRIGHWVAAHETLRLSRHSLLAEIEGPMLRSLWQQAAYLHEHLEWDLRANHLLRDAAGLAHAGRFFEGAEPRRWLRTATEIAAAQACEQVLPDGGHFERSPMYHVHVMEDLLGLWTLVEDAAVRDAMRETWKRMAEFLVWVRHPDGLIPLFNDAALNGAAEPAAVLNTGNAALGLNLAIERPSGRRHFADSGLVVWHERDWSVFFDVGPVGPDYQPGHAHADTLSVECSYRGRRLFVDAGTFAYDNDANRKYDRSTAAHNTVCIDGQDSTEVWHVFRVARRAKPEDVAVFDDRQPLMARASHTGYDHLPGRPRHTRSVSVQADVLSVSDAITGHGSHRVDGSWLLAPGWSVERDGEGWVARQGSEAIRIRIEGPASMAVQQVYPAAYHPEFGKECPTTRLAWRYEGRLPLEVTATVWSDDRPADAH